MTRLIRALQTYLLLALPFVIAIMVWGTLQPEREIALSGSSLAYAAWTVLAWNLMIWFALLVIFLVLMVIVPDARERTLMRLANVRERDEREAYITGRASRSVYVSTLSLLLLLLFLSIFSLRIYRVSPAEAINGKTGISSISMTLNLLDKPRSMTEPGQTGIFDVSDIPLSKTAIILLLLVWQLGAFNFSARRLATE